MAGTATVTQLYKSRKVKSYSIAWTSTAGGAVSANAFATIGGYIVRVTVVPGSGGSAPTDLYDATLVDADNIDVLDATGANLAAATGVTFNFDPPLFLPSGGTLDLVIANAGNAKTGRVDIYIDGDVT